MEQQTVVAETSPAPVMEVSRGAVVDLTPEQRTEWKKTGELPKAEVPKTEEPAASSEDTSQEDQPDSATTPDGEKQPEPKQTKPQERQQKPKPTAEERIAQLEATIEKIRKGSGVERKAEVAPVIPEPAKDTQYTRPKPTMTDKDDKGNPKYNEYEDFVEDLADWKAEQRIANQQREDQQKSQQQKMQTKVDEAKQRYGDKFDSVVNPTLDTIIADNSINGVVKAMIGESDLLPDLLYTIGSDDAEMTSFIKMAKSEPGKALRYIALTESLIREELEKPAKSEEVPVKPVTQAPRPPAEVGGRAASPGDALESAAKAGDFRSFKAEATRRQLAAMKG